jgi:ligand-binding sensor domain-containing protein
MKYVPVYGLFLMFGFCIYCKGQVKKDLPKGEVSKQKIITAGQPKLVKTQGSQPGDNVNSSLQDKAGNLWFGTTNEGLYKYDGKSFRQFTGANGLNSNRVHCLLEDKDGKIWIGTEAGVCVYDGKTFTIVPIPLRKNLPANQYRNTHNVFSIMQDKSGKLWFATIDGVYIYDGNSFTPFIVKEGGGGYMSSNPNVEYILEDKAGNIWFGGRGNEGVFRYDGKTITNLKVSEHKDFNWAWPALQDKQGNIWFSNWQGAFRYDGQSFIKLDGLATGPVSPITRIIEDKKGNLWLGGMATPGGLWRYDGTSLTRFMVRDGLPHNDVWSILEDRTGNLWVGTRNTGLSRYDGKTFTHFTTNSGQPIKIF